MAATEDTNLLDPALYPDSRLLITEDGKPVDNLFVEKQYRLLTEPLWTSWTAPDNRPFRVLANVGLSFEYRKPPLVPDAMFAIDVDSPPHTRESDYRSYFVWVVGKVPDIVIEIVSDKRGGEDTDKLKAYQRIGVPYYVLFDPDEVLKKETLRTFALNEGKYRRIDHARFGDLGLGLTLWEGEVEGGQDTWLRWIDAEGLVIPNAKERTQTAEHRAETAEHRAETAEQRLKLLEEKLRLAGIAPNGNP